MAQRPFVYRPRTVEDVLQRAQDNENRPGIFLPSYNIYKVRNGENWIRILPATWDDARHWGFDVFVHGGVGADRATVLCNARMGNGKCPGCEIRVQEERAGADEATLRQLNATHRTVAWLIDRKAEEEGPQLWAMPYQSVDLEIQARSIDRTNGELYLVDDLEAGYDVTFNKTGKDLATRYVGVELVRHPSAIDQVYFDYVIDHPIPECLIWRSYEQVLEMYTGGMIDANAPTIAPRGAGLPTLPYAWVDHARPEPAGPRQRSSVPPPTARPCLPGALSPARATHLAEHLPKRPQRPPHGARAGGRHRKRRRLITIEGSNTQSIQISPHQQSRTTASTHRSTNRSTNMMEGNNTKPNPLVKRHRPGMKIPMRSTTVTHHNSHNSHNSTRGMYNVRYSLGNSKHLYCPRAVW